jgi:hypothetical protein
VTAALTSVTASPGTLATARIILLAFTYSTYPQAIKLFCATSVASVLASSRIGCPSYAF